MISPKTVTTSTACLCCELGIKCRTRGGNVSPKKWQAFDGSEVYYKNEAADNGNVTLCDSSDVVSSGCDKVDRVVKTWNYNGSCQFNEDGSITGTISMKQYTEERTTPTGDCTAAGGSPPSTSKCGQNFGGATTDLLYPAVMFPLPTNTGYSITKTATSAKFQGGNSCEVISGSGGTRQCEVTGSITLTLSDEDTEDDAIARNQAESWSSWVDGDSTSCLSRWGGVNAAVTSWVAVYQEAQWEVVRTGLIPSHTYTISVPMYRRTFGSGSYSLYTTITGTATADGSGNLVASGDVPIDDGYETYADGPTTTVTA